MYKFVFYFRYKAKSTLNNSKRLLFIFPLLALSMWVSGIGQNLNTVTGFSNSKFSQEKKNKEVTKVTYSSFEDGEINIIESESEIESEIEWVESDNSANNFNLKVKEKKIQLQEFSNFSSKKIIPLYDLYCNWKFHLS